MNEELKSRETQIIILIEHTLNLSFGKKSLLEVLRDGIVLCKLMQSGFESTIPFIHEPSNSNLQKKENVTFFLIAADRIGIPRSRQFSFSNLSNPSSLIYVIQCLEDFFALKSGKGLSEINSSKNVRTSLAFPSKETIGLFKLKSEIEQKKIEHCITSFQARVRGCIARRTYQERRICHAFRSMLVKHFIENEENYLRQLNLLKTIYYIPLKESIETGKPILKQSELIELFSDSIESIIKFSSRILSEFQIVNNSWSPSSSIKDLIVELKQFMTAYSKYSENFSTVSATLEKLKPRTKFNQFLLECSTNSEVSLIDYLSLPVQRIAEYTKTIQDLSKNTWADHQDYQVLKECSEKMAEVNKYINKKRIIDENMAKLKEIEKKLSGKSLHSLVSEDRFLVKQGEISIVYPEESKAKLRNLFLFNDRLLITRRIKAPTFGSIRTKEVFKVKEDLRLTHIQPIMKECLDPAFPTSFFLYGKYNLIGRIVLATKSEQKEWIKAFNSTKEKLENQKESTYQATLEKSHKKAEEAKEKLTLLYGKLRERSDTQDTRDRSSTDFDSTRMVPVKQISFEEESKSKSSSLPRKTGKKLFQIKERLNHLPPPLPPNTDMKHRRSLSNDSRPLFLSANQSNINLNDLN